MQKQKLLSNLYFKITIVILGLSSCSSRDYKYKIPIESNFFVHFHSNGILKQKTDTIYSDNSGLKNIINVFSNKTDTSKFRIIFNDYGYDKSCIKNIKDLSVELSTYKVNSIPNTKILKIDSIQIGNLTYLKIDYDIKQFGYVTIYSVVFKNKIINFEFISNKILNPFFISEEKNIMNSLVFKN